MLDSSMRSSCGSYMLMESMGAVAAVVRHDPEMICTPCPSSSAGHTLVQMQYCQSEMIRPTVFHGSQVPVHACRSLPSALSPDMS